MYGLLAACSHHFIMHGLCCASASQPTSCPAAPAISSSQPALCLRWVIYMLPSLLAACSHRFITPSLCFTSTILSTCCPACWLFRMTFHRTQSLLCLFQHHISSYHGLLATLFRCFILPCIHYVSAGLSTCCTVASCFQSSCSAYTMPLLA